MLLQLYDRSIDSLTLAKTSYEADDMVAYAKFFISAQKAILAIHSGLKPDEYDVAFNIARLLHFVLSCIEKKNFSDAIKILKEMRIGFEAVRDEANQLEQQGQIPPMEGSDVYKAMA